VVCGAIAGRVQVATSGEPFTDGSRPALRALAELDAVARPERQAALVVDTFFGVAGQPVPSDRIGSVAEAIADNYASALYRISYSYAPFHCPDCAASYCGDHWNWRTFEDDPFSGVEGECPRGHFHVLAY
jgi:hypothetical protein